MLNSHVLFRELRCLAMLVQNVRLLQGSGMRWGRLVRYCRVRTIHLVSRRGTRAAVSLRRASLRPNGAGSNVAVLCRQLSVSSAVCGSVPGKHARTEVWGQPLEEAGTGSVSESWQDQADVSLVESSGTTEVADVVSQASELSALGLGNYTPVGLVQHALEFLHVHAHMPWWLAVVSATVALRVALLPVVVRMQRNAATMANLQPQVEVIQRRIQLYKQMDNQEAVVREATELIQLYRRHNAHPLKVLMMPFLQLPIFISFFIALRRMAQAPVVSMQSGGVLWFTDLTVPDPFFALPLMACGAFLSNIEVCVYVRVYVRACMDSLFLPACIARW